MKPPAYQLAELEQRSSHAVVTEDGVRISFDLYHRVGRQAVVIICPGFFQTKEAAIFQRLAHDLAKDQDVLCMDFRGHGRSGGFYTFSAREGADLEAVLEWARGRYSEISILGFSLGGAIAINTAARFPDSIHSLIAVS
ncbi:MAG: alpha/beta fold hydrolase, partial [Candidatus Omnitrophica bacterium]|nr:alpha/beta fold hydrolase [Candidatus Omnitrophota bacterium]